MFYQVVELMFRGQIREDCVNPPLSLRALSLLPSPAHARADVCTQIPRTPDLACMGLNIHGATEGDTGNAALDARSFMELNIHGPLKAIRAMLQSIHTCQT